MNSNTLYTIAVQLGLLAALALAQSSAVACTFTKDALGRIVYTDCTIQQNTPQLRMPNLRVNSAVIDPAAGGGTGFVVGFDIINAGQADTDKSLAITLHYLDGQPPDGFDIDTVVYVVSEDHRSNFHYDTATGQFMPYSPHSFRINRLAAGATHAFAFGDPFAPQFFLQDRSQTYKIGLVVEIDEPAGASSPLSSMQHGEIIESDESDNHYNLECLIYAEGLGDLTEIWEIAHFHVNNDLTLPLIPPC